MLKKALSVLLSVIMAFSVFTILPFEVSAAEEEIAETGVEFTEIRTVEDLYMINMDLAGNYKLMNDIDLTEATAEGGDWDFMGNGWEPIGSNGIYSGETPFTGTFDGNGYEIKGLRIKIEHIASKTDKYYVGLFANNKGIIKNLTVSGNIKALVEYVEGIGRINTDYAGSIAGYNSGTIECCCNKADIYIWNGERVGGIAGCTDGGRISQCYNSGSVSADRDKWAKESFTSAITYIMNKAVVCDCYNTGDISGNIYNYPEYVYPAGIGYSSGGTIKNCYNIGTAKYAISYGTVTNCYYLSGSGSYTTGAKALSAAQMKLKAMYNGFDFDSVWFIDASGDYNYPQLRNNAANSYPLEEISISNISMDIDTTKDIFVNFIPDYTTDSRSIIWTSSDNSIASVDNNGTVTAHQKGSVTITATSVNGKTASCTVNVLVPITGIDITKPSETIARGTKKKLAYTITPNDPTDTYTWSSSDTSIASVDKYGTVTAKKVGTADITLTSSRGISDTCMVKVNSPATSLQLSNNDASLFAGKSLTLTTTMAPYDVTDTVNWTSSDSNVAAVKDGKITAKAKGTAFITATAESGVSDTCLVVVESDINNMDIYLDYEETQYDTNAKEPAVEVYYRNELLTEDTDYRIEYDNNTDAGEATVTIYSLQDDSSVEKHFTITPVDITDCTIRSHNSMVYTGQALDCIDDITFNGIKLVKGTDFTVSYSNNVNIGTGTVTITGNGNYTGSTQRFFTISAKSIENTSVTLSVNTFTYDGTAKTPSVTVKDGTRRLTEDTDYTIEYLDNTNAGSAAVKVTGKGNYGGTTTKNFTINPKSITNLDVSLEIMSFTYDGTEKRAPVTVKDGDKVLFNDTDYSVSYSNNKNVGTATATVTGKGNYKDMVNKSFTIVEAPKIDISACTITLGATAYTYDGTEKKPSVAVKYNGSTLLNSTDYSVAYSNNINAGNATVTITGKGGYTGTTTRSFLISAKSISSAVVTLSPTTYTFDGTEKKPTVTVKDGTKTLTGGNDYTVSYANNKNIGTATATVTGKGNYSGTVSKSFTITEAPKVNVSNCTITLGTTSYTYDGTEKKPSVTVKYSSTTLTSGTDYSITYSDNVNAGSAKVTVTGKGDYTGSATKNFTISAKSISSASVTLNQTSYTFDGSEKKPTVTVKDGSKTLANGTDYSASYSNNINVGTATVIVTGKGNYSGTLSKNFTINPKPVVAFNWGQDNWNYNNSSAEGYFANTTYRKQVNSDYLNVLRNNLTNSEYQAIFVGSWYEDAWLDDYWGGSCYGMSSTTLLAKEGLLPYSSYKYGATNLHALSYPKSDSKISSLVTYYQMLQIKDVIQQQYRTVPYHSNSTNINEIIELLRTHSTVLVGFQKSGWGGHAILATGYEYGSWTWNGVSYQGCIKICDPNNSVNYDKKFNIYFNTQSYNWTIPAYSGMTSANGARFNYIGANVTEINKGGYLTGASGNRAENFVARIDATAIADNRSVTKVRASNGSYVNMNTAPGDIIEDYSYVLGNESEGTIGYNLYDSTASYKVSQDSPQNLQLKIDYENCNLTAGSKAGNTILFDQEGYIEVHGESAEYNFEMTYDKDYPTDWFAIQIKGNGADIASLKQVNHGYVLSSDNLNGVEVKANNFDDIATVSFSTDYDSVFLYEINETTIGVLADTDNNGTYDTNLLTGKSADTRILGDVDSSDDVEIRDATWIQRHIVSLEIPFAFNDTVADVDCNEDVNIMDVTAIQYYLAKMKTNYRIGKIIG